MNTYPIEFSVSSSSLKKKTILSFKQLKHITNLHNNYSKPF